MFSKKGFTIQISWFFILIVGAVILIFVTRLISGIGQVSNTEIGVEILTNVDSILASAEQSTNTFKILKTPLLDLTYTCRDDVSSYSINGNGKEIGNMIVYSAESIQGRTIYTWSLEFAMPMKITNILYITDPDNKYYFVGDNDPTINYILNKFPANTTLEQVNQLSELKETSYESYTIVSTQPPMENMLNIEGVNGLFLKNSKYIQIVSQVGQENQGIIKFYEFEGPSWNPVLKGEYSYIDDSMLFGAIFSPDYETYACVSKKILDKMKNIYSIYAYTVQTKNEGVTKYVCTDLTRGYPKIITIFDSLKELLNSITEESNDDQVSAAFQTIYSDSVSLVSKNRYLQVNDCPVIY
jgi:hypothetical protein